MASTDDDKMSSPRTGAPLASGGGGGTSAAANALLDRGLQMYGDGDLLGAITEWEAALTIDPGLARAREYVEYVRANFDALTQQFDAVRDAERAAEEQGVPVRDVPDDPEAYDSLDVELAVGGDGDEDEIEIGLAALDAGLEDAMSSEPPSSEDAGTSPPPLEPEVIELDAEPEEGMGLDSPSVELEAMAPDEDLPGIAPGLDDETPAPFRSMVGDDEATIDVRMHVLLKRQSGPDDRSSPPAPTEPRPGILTIQPRGAFSMPGIEGDVEREPDDDVEATQAFDRRQGGIVVTPHRGPAFDFDEPELAEGPEDEDFHQTSERGPFRLPTPSEGPLVPDESSEDGTRPGPRQPQRRGSSVIVDERLLKGAGLMGHTPPVPDLERTVEFKAAKKDARVAATTRKVTELLQRAQEAAAENKFVEAVEAVEEATRCDEDGSIAPVLLHRHRDMLYRIYEGQIGDLSAVPFVAVPLHEISAQALDHRTGFLLSRIDGMLTFEDILDVAGMPRMEAYQILSLLLRKRVIEVR